MTERTTTTKVIAVQLTNAVVYNMSLHSLRVVFRRLTAILVTAIPPCLSGHGNGDISTSRYGEQHQIWPENRDLEAL